MIPVPVSRLLSAAAAAYAGVLLARYFFPPHIPRYQLESALIVAAAVGTLAVLLRPGASAPAEPRAPHSPWFWATLAALFVPAAFLLYWPALRVGFLSDDFVLADWARRGELIHLAETGFVRPGVPLLWAALARLPADLAAAAHVANVFCHGVNAVLVAAVASRLRAPRDAVVAAGVLFLAFPGLSEAVVWTSGGQDVLMTTFCLAAVVIATSERRVRVAVALAAGAAALMVKETAAIVPVVAALVVWGRGDRVASGPSRRPIAALVLLSAVYALGRLALGVPSGFLQVGDWRYFAKQLLAGAFAAVGAPWTNEWGRLHPIAAFGHAALILAMMTAGFWMWRRRGAAFRQSIAAAAWVIAGVLPVFSLFYVGPFLEGGRYVYLSACGFALMLALLAATVSARAPLAFRAVSLAALTAALSVPVVPAISSDIRRWQAAADVRDRILGSASVKPEGGQCSAYEARGSADSVDGAFVFRNGLSQALGVAPDGAGAPCRVDWTGGDVVIAPAAP